MQRVVGIVLLVCGFIFTVGIWGMVLAEKKEPAFFEMMFPIVFLIIAATLTIRAYRNRVRLSETAIELRGLSSQTVLPFDKIRGRRRYFDPGDKNTPGLWHLVFEPNDDRFNKIDIEDSYQFDGFFQEWFHALPDLDELDKNRPKPSNFGLV